MRSVFAIASLCLLVTLAACGQTPTQVASGATAGFEGLVCIADAAGKVTVATKNNSTVQNVIGGAGAAGQSLLTDTACANAIQSGLAAVPAGLTAPTPATPAPTPAPTAAHAAIDPTVAATPVS